MKKILYSLIALFILTPNLFSETIKLWHGKNAGLGAEAVTLTIHLPKKTPERTSMIRYLSWWWLRYMRYDL